MLFVLNSGLSDFSKTSASIQNGVTRMGICLPRCTTRKPYKIHEIIVFRHWTTDNTRQWFIKEEGKQVTLDLWVFRLTGSFWTVSEKWQTRAQQSCWDKETVCCSRKPIWIEFARQKTREKRAAQREPGGYEYRSPQVFDLVLICPWIREQPKAEERTTGQ